MALPADIGLTLEVPLSLAIGPLMNLLFGVAPSDALTVAAAAITMLGIALVAGLLPALRAARMDALHALRTK